MSVSHLPIVIVGGGIGGLTTALALAQRGRRSVVLERHATFTEAGAGIQLGPNGMRVLPQGSVSIVSSSRRPASLIASACTTRFPARSCTELPIGEAFAARHGAPYRTAHRADLQAALLEGVRKSPLITVQTAFEVNQIADDGGSVRVFASSGQMVEGAVAIAADGASSAMRRLLIDDVPFPAPTHVAARTLIPADEIHSEAISTSCVTIWMARDAHVVHYPVRGGRQIAVVFVVEENGGSADWTTPAEATAFAPHLGKLARPLRAFLALGKDWRKWSLYDVKPWKQWARGRIALLGDAAHPPLPFFAQGGVMALEDAVTVADCLIEGGNDPVTALVNYEKKRRPRATAVQRASRNNGRIYHLAGPMAFARNLALRSANPERLMARYDWLYGWRA